LICQNPACLWGRLSALPRWNCLPILVY